MSEPRALPSIGPVDPKYTPPEHRVCREWARLADELAGQVRIVKVDVDDSVSLAVSHDIQSAPTLVLYHNGVPVGMNTCPTGRASALKLLEPVLQR